MAQLDTGGGNGKGKKSKQKKKTLQEKSILKMSFPNLVQSLKIYKIV